MVSILRRQQLLAASIEVRAVEVRKVWIAASFLAAGKEIQHPVLLVDMEHLRDRTLAVCDLALQLTRRQVIQVHLPIVRSFGIPEEFVGVRQITPVHVVLTALVEAVNVLVIDIADLAGFGVSDAQRLVLVVAARRDKGKMFAIGRELHIIPACTAATTHVIA